MKLEVERVDKMIAFAKLEKHSLVCFGDEKLHIVKRRDILDKKVTVRNIRVVNGKLEGKAFNLDKLPEYKKESRVVTIIKARLTENGQGIVGYYYINSFGKGYYTTKDDLYTFRKVTVLNGKIDKGYMIVTNIECIDTEQVQKTVHYCIDDYHKMYKLYNNAGLITHDNKSVSSTTELFGRQQEYSNSSFENFVNYHKEIYGILNKSEILRVVKIGSSNTVQANQIEVSEKFEFYVVTFKYRAYTKSLVVHKSDNKMMQLIKNKGGKLADTTIKDIKNIIYDKESLDKTISGKSLVDKLEVEKNLDKLSSELGSCAEIKIEQGRLKINEEEFKLRRNILIGSSDFRLMMAA